MIGRRAHPRGNAATLEKRQRVETDGAGDGIEPARSSLGIGRRFEIQNLGSIGLVADDPKPLILQGPIPVVWTISLLRAPVLLCFWCLQSAAVSADRTASF
jgi:hypothetical protein